MGIGNGHCEKCLWWGAERRHDDNVPVGTCRRDTPQVTNKMQALPYHDPNRPEVAGPIVFRGMWPWVAFDDWCGGFEAEESAMLSRRPVAFRVRDCADGWLLYQDEGEAYKEAESRGAMMQGLYARDGKQR